MPTKEMEISDAAKSGNGTIEKVGIKVDGKFKSPVNNQLFDTQEALDLHLKYLHDPRKSSTLEASGSGAGDIIGFWKSEKGECHIFNDKVTSQLYYEELIGDGSERLHGKLEAIDADEDGNLRWQASLCILEEDGVPSYDPSCGEKPEAIGDLRLVLHKGRFLGPKKKVETSIREGDEDFGEQTVFMILDDIDQVEAPALGPVWSTKQTQLLRPEKHDLRRNGILKGVIIDFEKVSMAVAALTRGDSTKIPDDVYKEGYCIVFHKERKKHYLIFRSDVLKVVEDKFDFDAGAELLP